MKHKIYLLTLILGFVANHILAQDWNIEDPDIQSPFEFNDENISKGKELYMTNCKSCHGDPGKNNALPLDPPPPDITTDQVQNNSDAELFYKVLNGKGAMPQFKAVLGEDGVWQTITFLRSFNESYKPADDVEKATQLIEGPAKIKVTLNPEEKKISASVSFIDEEGNEQPLEGNLVNFAVKRYFGNLKFSSAKTNANGVATVDFPTDIPGDTTGLVDLVVSLGGELEGVESTLENASIGIPTTPIDIFEKRVLWSTNDKTQWWIILSYLGVVFGVWVTIFYIVGQIVQIQKLGKE